MRTPRLRNKRRTRKLRGGDVGNAEITATIVDQASTQVLRLTMPPGAALQTDQNTMAFMTGQLKTTASMGGSRQGAQKGAGFFNAFKRIISGESFFVNQVVNQSQETAEITLSPTIPSAIAELVVQPGEEWKLYPGAMMAATPNVRVSGSLNIFENFKSSFVTGSAVYTSVSVPAGGAAGRVWISGFGGIEKRDITPSTTPFILNNGVFLAMPAQHWGNYVKVGTAGGILDSFMTSIGFVMKIQASAEGTHPTIPLYMQTINIHNFENMIKTIAAAEVSSQASSFRLSSRSAPMQSSFPEAAEMVEEPVAEEPEVAEPEVAEPEVAEPEVAEEQA
jgi:uncharacterized protein (AIM24 family)